jgi:hypothetical protein
MKTLYPETYVYMYRLAEHGRQILSDLTPEERRYATNYYLAEFNDKKDAFELPAGTCFQLSQILRQNRNPDCTQRQLTERKLLKSIFESHKSTLDNIFEDALWDYRQEHVNAIVSEHTDWRKQDNRERHRSIA